MIETTAVPATGTAPRQSRRRFLSRAGSLAALTALTGTGVLTWRTASQGVLAPATGRAYEAWGQFRARSPQPLDLVRAAVLAANAHNTQPWRFRLFPDRIDLHAVPERTTGTMDQLRREMYLSLGCALENLTLAAAAAGLAPSVQVVPDPADPTLAASVRLGPGITVDASGLPPLIRAAGKLMPDQTRAQYGASWIASTRDTHVATAAAFGAVVVHDPADHAQRVRAGRVWQRLHLWATAHGLALQP